MSSYPPPECDLDILAQRFNELCFTHTDDSLITQTIADSRYIKRTGGIALSQTTFNGGLNSLDDIIVADTQSIVNSSANTDITFGASTLDMNFANSTLELNNDDFILKNNADEGNILFNVRSEDNCDILFEADIDNAITETGPRLQMCSDIGIVYGEVTLTSANDFQWSVYDNLSTSDIVFRTGGLSSGVSSPGVMKTFSVDATECMRLSGEQQVIIQAKGPFRPSIAFTGDIDTGIYRKTFNSIGFSSQGVAAAFINQDGVNTEPGYRLIGPLEPVLGGDSITEFVEGVWDAAASITSTVNLSGSTTSTGSYKVVNGFVHGVLEVVGYSSTTTIATIGLTMKPPLTTGVTNTTPYFGSVLLQYGAVGAANYQQAAILNNTAGDSDITIDSIGNAIAATTVRFIIHVVYQI